MTRRTFFLSGCFISALTLAPAWAGTISTYNDRSAFESAAGTVTVEDFTSTFHFPITIGSLNSQTNLPDIGITPGLIQAGVTYSAAVPNSGANYFNIDAGGGFSGGFLDTLNVPRPITVTFDQPNAAFGFDTNSLAGSLTVTIFFADLSSTTFFTPAIDQMSFFGYQSSAADITSAVISGNSDTFGAAFDNFTFTNGVTNTPEPNTLLLLAPALGVLAVIRKRQRV